MSTRVAHMESFLSKCCDRCTLTEGSACADFVACRQGNKMCHDDPACHAAILDLRDRLLYGSNEVPTITIGMGTCGVAAGAVKVKETIEAELAKHGARAEIDQTGCIGLCQEEVLVDVKKPGGARVSYGGITPERVPQLVERCVVGDDVIDEWALARIPVDPFRPNGHAMARPEAADRVSYLNDLPSRRKQKTLALGLCGYIDPESIDEYLAHGGYGALSKALNTMKPEQVVNEVKVSGLRGRGGAGFPTGRKWEFARSAPGPDKYIICNADEGDPGAFMDRAIVEGDPHRVLEGLIIAGYAIGASEGYIYVRAEYPLAVRRIINAIAQARQYAFLGKNIIGSGFSFDVKVRKGAGAFVCGEETALIASLEGKRGMPRPRPPFPAISGFRNRSSTINNVETLANIPRIVEMGGQWLSNIGTARSKGTKVFAVTGKVRNTGLVEVPMGTTLREVIFDICGGIVEGHRFKAVQIGGPSGGCLPESMLDLPVDYDSLTESGAIMGSGGMVVLDETTCMVDLTHFFLSFTTSESCGKCTPCREGTKRMLEILDRITTSRRHEKNADALQRFQGVIQLERLAQVVKDTALCGLGQTAPNPVLTTLRYFRDEYEAHVYDRKCPAGACRGLLTYSIDVEKCKGCQLCQKNCPEGAILGEKKSAHFIVDDKCIRCGRCYDSRRLEAVRVV